MKIKYNFDQLKSVVREHFLPKLDKYAIFTFQGPLGAGKTCLIKEFLKQCGVDVIVTSPTFNYVNVYKTLDNKVFNHFDLYRINSLDSFLQAGFDEYFYRDLVDKNSWCFVEWPEVIKDFLVQDGVSQNVCRVDLSYDPIDLTYRWIEFFSIKPFR